MADSKTSLPAIQAPLSDPDTERALIGALLIEPERASNVIEQKHLTPEHFTEKRYRQLFTALDELLRNGGGLDIVTLADKLRARHPEEPTTIPYLTQLMDAAPTSLHAAYYADILIELHERRKIDAAAIQISANAHDRQQTPELIRANAEQTLFALGTPEQAMSELSWAQASEQSYTEILDLIEHPGKRSGLPTGYPTLDVALGGFAPGSLNILGARPGIGKTSLALNIVENVTRGADLYGNPLDPTSATLTPRDVLLFSLEMPTEQLTRRMLLAHAGLPAQLFNARKPFFDESSKDDLRRGLEEIRNLPLHVEARGGLDIADIRARTRRHMRKHPLGLVVVDYIGLVHNKAAGKFQNYTYVIAGITRELKSMAVEFKIPILALSQLNRNIEQRANDEPQLSDLRDSGSIEQDADTVLFLHRKRGENATKLHLAKYRNGQEGVTINLTFDGKFTRFSEAKAA